MAHPRFHPCPHSKHQPSGVLRAEIQNESPICTPFSIATASVLSLPMFFIHLSASVSPHNAFSPSLDLGKHKSDDSIPVL